MNFSISKCFSYVNGKEYRDNDQSIEILMSELDPKIMDIFHKKNTASAEIATKVFRNDLVNSSVIILPFSWNWNSLTMLLFLSFASSNLSSS